MFGCGGVVCKPKTVVTVGTATASAFHMRLKLEHYESRIRAVWLLAVETACSTSEHDTRKRCAWCGAVGFCRAAMLPRCSAAVGRGRRCATRCRRSSGSPPRRSITSGPGYNSVLCEQPAGVCTMWCCCATIPAIGPPLQSSPQPSPAPRMPLLPSSPPSPPWLPQAVPKPSPMVAPSRPAHGVRVGRF